jgi:hypothetical protein
VLIEEAQALRDGIHTDLLSPDNYNETQRLQDLLHRTSILTTILEHESGRSTASIASPVELPQHLNIQ